MIMLNILLAWLKVYWLDVAVVSVACAIVIVLLRRGKAGTAKQIILFMVVKAEKALGSGTGPLKYATVIAAIYDRLPVLMRLLFTKKELGEFLEEAVVKLKSILQDPEINLMTYEQEAVATRSKYLPTEL
ncbi:MAG: hypothetical protein NHB14_20655 [Desulfosporosinus sp.]|nr:hypothetical protein [Desulfosporosinus sp.]